MRSRFLLLLVTVVAACGDDDDVSGPFDARTPDAPPPPRLNDFLPVVPPPTGGARETFAGTITAGNSAELIPGPARSGLVGDVFMRSASARFVIQAPGRSIGIVPFGGNLVDAVQIGAGNTDVTGDHFGELGLVYLLGRTCQHTSIAVLRDGSGGGAAVVRAIGKSAVNDYINLPAVSAQLPLPSTIHPDNPDDIACATTFTLEPGSSTLEIAWTLYNPGPNPVQGPIGALNDVGGEVQVFSPVQGFTHISGGGFDAILSGTAVPVPYHVYQGPGVAYGVLPRLDDLAKFNASLVISGAATLVFGLDSFIGILNRSLDGLKLNADAGATVRVDFAVARDAAAIDELFRRGRGETVTGISGEVRFQPSDTPARARVVLFRDTAVNGTLEAGDPVITYLETDADGHFAGAVPPGEYLALADVRDVARSSLARVTVASAAVVVPELELADPAVIDFKVVDDADPAQTIPAKLTVVGRLPFARDSRLNETTERRLGIVQTAFAVHGTSTPEGQDPGDAPLVVPGGGPYRVWVSRGPEWSVASFAVSPAAGAHVTLPVARLRRVVDTSGYVATAFHEHALGSPDSPVSFEDRLASLVTEGIELFAGTDHDRLTDYAPLIDAAGLRGIVDSVVGVETTPFAYGHFNAYPLEIDEGEAANGAIDWPRGTGGFAMLPGEIFDAMRDRGAEVVQVCHPRSDGFQGYFGRTGMVVDYDTRTIHGDAALQDFPASALRLPDTDLFSGDFNALEVWNGFGQSDTDADGVREITSLDRVLRDYLSFLSLGKIVTPVGNGDTHTRETSAAGMPRTLVRVPSDSSAALTAGLADDVWATMTGSSRDVVVTNAPMITVTSGGAPALGRTIAASAGEVTLDITASVAGWTDFDTIEIFANLTPPRLTGSMSTALKPAICYTTRTNLAATDPCLGARALTVTTVDVGGQTRREAHVTVTIGVDEIPRRAGATGADAWLVVRARGTRGLFPVLPDDAVSEDTLDELLAGDLTVLVGRGIGASAFTAPVFVDFDGGGWRAPFAP